MIVKVMIVKCNLLASITVSVKLNDCSVVQETSGKWHLYCYTYNNSNRVLMQQCPDYLSNRPQVSVGYLTIRL